MVGGWWLVDGNCCCALELETHRSGHAGFICKHLRKMPKTPSRFWARRLGRGVEGGLRGSQRPGNEINLCGLGGAGSLREQLEAPLEAEAV